MPGRRNPAGGDPGGRFSCEITEIARIFAPFFRVLAAEFCRKIPPFPVISHPHARLTHPATALTRKTDHPPARAVVATAKKPSRGVRERKRCDAPLAGAPALQPRSARLRGTMRPDGGAPSRHRLPPSRSPGTRCPPRCSRLPSFSPPRLAPSARLLVPSPLRPAPSDQLLTPFSPRTRPEDGLTRRRGVFRARLRKLLAFLPRFSVFSRPNFAPKNAHFPVISRLFSVILHFPPPRPCASANHAPRGVVERVGCGEDVGAAPRGVPSSARASFRFRIAFHAKPRMLPWGITAAAPPTLFPLSPAWRMIRGGEGGRD